MITFRIIPGGIEAIMDGPVMEDVERRANQIADRARRFVPIDTGALQGTIRVEDGDDETILVKAGGQGDVDYALYVELGTSKMMAQPYMRPAIDGLP